MRLAGVCLLMQLAAPAVAQTQARMNADAATAFRAADAALNRQWAETWAAFKRRDASGGQANALLASQRAWLRFRDAQCAVEGNAYAGGTLQAMTVTDCRARLTNERRVQLRDMTRRV